MDVDVKVNEVAIDMKCKDQGRQGDPVRTRCSLVQKLDVELSSIRIA